MDGLRLITDDTREEEEIRGVALDAYANYDQADLFEFAASVLRDPSAGTELRLTAARVLIDREDAGTRDPLHEVIRSTEDEELLVTLVDGLDEHGDATSIELLRELGARTQDDVLLQVIDETIESLEGQ